MVATIVNLSSFEFSAGLDAYNNVVKLLYYAYMDDIFILRWTRGLALVDDTEIWAGRKTLVQPSRGGFSPQKRPSAPLYNVSQRGVYIISNDDQDWKHRTCFVVAIHLSLCIATILEVQIRWTKTFELKFSTDSYLQIMVWYFYKAHHKWAVYWLQLIDC